MNTAQETNNGDPLKQVAINGKLIGPGKPAYIIAEAGVNHNGEVEIAKKLIEKALNADVDAVKFQTFKTESIVTKNAKTATYQKKNAGKESQYELLKELELNEDETREIMRYSRKKGITFISTPFDVESCQLLQEMGATAYKISSGDLTNTPLLEAASRQRKPILLSTGMANICEIEEAVKTIKEYRAPLILLHCVTQYPAPPENLNLRAIKTLKRIFGLPTGFSDHSTSIYLSAVAVALGADVIEKHFTLNKDLPGPDHSASLNPEELKELVSTIRNTEKALGNGIKKPTEEEEKIKKSVRRSIVASRNILKGEKIQRNMIAFKRPAGGIEPRHYRTIIGKKARKNINVDQQITWADIE